MLRFLSHRSPQCEGTTRRQFLQVGGLATLGLLLSLMDQFPVVRAVLGAAAKREPPEKLQREAERLRGAYPWSDRLASVGWSLLFGSLLLRVLGLD